MKFFWHKPQPKPHCEKNTILAANSLDHIGTFLKVNILSQDFYDARVYFSDKNHDLTLLDYGGFSYLIGKITGYTHFSYSYINGPHCVIDNAPILAYALDIFPNVFTMNVYDSGMFQKFEKSTQEEYDKQLKDIRSIAELRMKEKLFSNEVRYEVIDFCFNSTVNLLDKLRICIDNPLESTIYISKLENRLSQMGEEFAYYGKPVDKLKKDFIELVIDVKS